MFIERFTKTLGQLSPPRLLGLCLAATSTAPFAEELDALLGSASEVPVVLTATRLKQSQSQTPGSVSIITEEMIRASGLRQITDILRLAPGMVTGSDISGYEKLASYHGTNLWRNVRMQVLVDGRSVYQPAMASVNWEDLPLAIEDIERIEIFRGPNASSYGANAFLGVINIITKVPGDNPGNTVYSRTGNTGIEDYYASASAGLGNHAFRFSAQSRADDGFDREPEHLDRNDGVSANTLNGRWFFRPDLNWTVDSQLGLAQTVKQEDRVPEDGLLTPPDMHTENGFASSRLTFTPKSSHQLDIKAYVSRYTFERQWQQAVSAILLSPELQALYRTDPDYTTAILDAYTSGITPGDEGFPAPQTPEQLAGLQSILATLNALNTAGLDTVVGNVNEKAIQSQVDIEIQDTWILGHTRRLVWGGGLRHDEGDSQVFLAGQRRQDSARMFVNQEWQLHPRWINNTGAMLEYESGHERIISPRAALNFLASPNSSFRWVYSEAVRTPDLFETHAHWSYRLRNIQPEIPWGNSRDYFIVAHGNPDLEREKIRAREFGYYYFAQDLGLSLDIKIFHDSMDDLISEPVSISTFRLSNGGHLTQEGVDTEINYRPSNRTLVRLNHAHIRSLEYHPEQEISMTPEDSGSILLDHLFLAGLRASAAYYYAYPVAYRNTFSRADLRIEPFSQFGPTRASAAFVLQHRFDESPDLRGRNFYEHSDTFIVDLRLDF